MLMLLAPSAACLPAGFRHVDVDPLLHDSMLARVQRLRGRVYLEDGAIEPWQVSSDGRHRLATDAASWHLVSMRPNREVTGCARYRPHRESVRPEDLGVWSSALAQSDQWRYKLRAAVEREIALARTRSLAYVEVGGWAIDREQRFSTLALEIALSTFALAETLGGCIGITTATVRNCSSKILRRLGGRALEFAGGCLPSYYDPQYKCEMEILRFDSRHPNPRFGGQLEDISQNLLDLPVICAADDNDDMQLPMAPPLPSFALLAGRACA
jgi:hypothetical protein